ncbi:MAG TPA: hypothetical protein VIO14_09800 [Dehalococcoidia bacterium]
MEQQGTTGAGRGRQPAPRLTVGSLMPGAQPPGTAGPPGAPADSPAAAREQVPPSFNEGYWAFSGGAVSGPPAGPDFTPGGVENLTYSNPFGQLVERVWFNGRVVYAIEGGEVEVDPSRVKVAQEYQIVYGVELDEAGKLKTEPDLVPGQYNIYDSVPGMEQYSPIWQFNFVVVPRDYVPNTLRSAEDCRTSGYPILRSNVFEN